MPVPQAPTRVVDELCRLANRRPAFRDPPHYGAARERFCAIPLSASCRHKDVASARTITPVADSSWTMSTRSPYRYAETLSPVSGLRYRDPRSMKSLHASVSSRGVNLSRALGSTTTLIALPRLRWTNQPGKRGKGRSVEVRPFLSSGSARYVTRYGPVIKMYGLVKPANVTEYVKLSSTRVPLRIRGVQFGFGQTCGASNGLAVASRTLSLVVPPFPTHLRTLSQGEIERITQQNYFLRYFVRLGEYAFRVTALMRWQVSRVADRCL